MQKVIVTGGAGFIGAHIVDALVERGDDVRIVDNYAAGKREDRINPKATYHDVDIRDFEKLAPIFKEAIYVFHEAALPRVQFSIDYPLESYSVNVMGTATVLRAAHEANVRRVIYASSGSAYGDQNTLPVREDMLVSPNSPYGLQKYMGEMLCRSWSEVYGLETVCLRYFNAYGPRTSPDGAYAQALGKFLKQKKEGKPLTIWGDGTHTRDFTHMTDVVNANLLAAESKNVGKGEALNIGTGREISVNEIAALIGGPKIHEPERREIARTAADNTRARELIGWQPQKKFEIGVAELKVEFGIA